MRHRQRSSEHSVTAVRRGLLVAILIAGTVGGVIGGGLASSAAAATRGGQTVRVKPFPNVKHYTKIKKSKANAAAIPAASTPLTALIDGDSVTTDDGLTDGSGPISLEQYAAEQLGYTVTVVDGATWDSMTQAQFAGYQLLIVGDPDCSETSSSATTNASTWAPVVMGTAPGTSTVGNRTVIGTDPEYHYLNGAGGAQPTDPTNPLTGGAEHLVEDGIHFAGAVSGATGAYFDTSCGDNGSDDSVLNQLSSTGTGWDDSFDLGESVPCGGSVSQVATNPDFNSGPTVLSDTDIEGWSCSDHVTFPDFPADFDALAVATDTSTLPTCGTDPDSGAAVCGQAYVLVAGEGVTSGAPNLSLAPPTGSDAAGGTHTVTATVSQGSPAAPVAGATVSFLITGQNAGVTGTCTTGSGTADPGCTTDANGVVKFTYTDTNGAGVDTINASVTLSGSTEHATAGETWTTSTGPTATQTSTTLSGGGKTGASITVPVSTAVTDTATLSGANAATAGGTVTYTVFSDAGCSTPVGTPDTVTVAGGVVPPSTSASLPTAGTYYWQAVYSGDPANQGSMSTCGSEVETVSPGTTSPPTCVLSSVITGPPKMILVTVQASAGIKAINVTEDVNDTVSMSSFTVGDTAPITVSATKTDQTGVSELALSVSDVNGATTTCDPADFTVRAGASQSVGGLAAAEHHLTIRNAGLSEVTLTVDGVSTVIPLHGNGIVQRNLAGLFHGADNSVTVSGAGSGSANVMLAD